MNSPSGSAEVHERIRRRAEEIYFRSGCIPGRDVQNWAQAELEILREAQPARRTAVVVEVDGVQYVGEYVCGSSNTYQAGEIPRGSSVQLRFEGNKMFLLRPNGAEIETTVVQRVG